MDEKRPTHADDTRSEESLQAFVQNVKEFAIYMLDREGRIATWNAGAERIKGYAAQEIVGRHFSQFYPREEVAARRPQRLLEEAVRNECVALEGWSVRKDGSQFWASGVLAALFDEQGELRGFWKVTRDATERRKLAFLGEAGAVLTASLDYATSLATVAKLSVAFLADWAAVRLLEGDRLRTIAIAHADPAKVELAWDLDRSDALDTSAVGARHVIDTGEAELIPEVTDAVLRRVARDAAHRRTLAGLGLRSAVTVPIPVQGASAGTMTFATAESGRRLDAATLELASELARRAGLAIENARAHQELEKERAWLRQVLQQMGSGILIAETTTGRIVLANSAAERMLGVAVGDDADLRSSKRLVRAGSPLEAADSPLLRALRGDDVVDEELTFAHGDAVLCVSASPVRNRDGAVVSAVATFQDVTERERAQRAAEQEGEFRERFMGILGHDLRNPLAAILNSAHLILRKDVREADRRAATRIATSAQRMGRMISDILDLTRIRQRDGMRMSPRNVSLREVCEEVVEELRVARPESTLRLEAEGRGWGEWDPDRIAQALSNVIANAIQYGREGAPVTVRMAERGSAVEVSVHNEGDPIPRELMSHLFDPFQRGDSERVRGTGGLGLGLYIARHIVSAHGGAIDVRSDESGTAFVIVLPREAESA